MAAIDLQQLRRQDFGTHEHAYDERDLALYALGVGCGAEDLRHVFEFHPRFAALPCFVCASALPATSLLPLSDILPRYDEGRRLHAEQFLQVLGPLPTGGTLRHRASLVHIAPKGKAAAVVCGVHTTLADGASVAYSEFTTFALGSGGFAVDNQTAHSNAAQRSPAATATNAPSERPPDAVLEEPISSSQAALYRLSGDPNPLHIDPAAAQALGFPRPILHGLCTMGIAARRLEAEFGGDGALQLRSIKVRFASHMFPGETLRIEAWRQQQAGSSGSSSSSSGGSSGGGNSISGAGDDGGGGTSIRFVFRASTVQRGKAVLTHAAVELAPVQQKARL